MVVAFAKADWPWLMIRGCIPCILLAYGLYERVFPGPLESGRYMTVEDLVKPHFVFRYTLPNQLYPLPIFQCTSCAFAFVINELLLRCL